MQIRELKAVICAEILVASCLLPLLALPALAQDSFSGGGGDFGGWGGGLNDPLGGVIIRPDEPFLEGGSLKEDYVPTQAPRIAGEATGPCAGATRVAISSMQLAVCNTAAMGLWVQIKQTDGGEPSDYYVDTAEWEIINTETDKSPIGTVSTDGLERSFILAAGRHYTIEAQDNSWVIAEITGN